MSEIVLLDSAPLGMLSNPKSTLTMKSVGPG
jgi:hypothetical protein